MGEWRGLVGRAVIVAALAGLAAAPSAEAACGSPGNNEIVVENCRLGNPASEWDVAGAGDPGIQGFATDISVAQGGTVRFKVDTTASDYRLDIYRMGYYGGAGARLVATVQPSVVLPQSQPACDEDGATGLIDCGNWAQSASWAVPPAATSGIYFAKLVREGGVTGASHVVFVVRDDDGAADVLFQTSDTTWQAYNDYGGNSLYTGNPAGRAYKVSYDRPFSTRENADEDWVFNSEYPMVRWLERNGYDVSYSTGVDSDRLGAELREHATFLSVGHDEYWSGTQRDNVEAARDVGVNLGFFSGNEVFWKTRWEDDHRTLVSYKETHANSKIDPQPIWTGTWRDPRPFNPEGGQPENALTGTIFTVNSGSAALRVPAEDGKLRFWRGTAVAGQPAGAVSELTADTIGYEWDEDLDNGARPAGQMRLSSTTVSGVEKLQDYGSTFADGSATHNLTLHRDPNGAGEDALVFGAGTVQWPWGLDGEHDRGNSAPNASMQQATVNLLADMDAQPMSLQPGLAAATASSDATAPTSAITAPGGGATVEQRSTVTIRGTAADSGGRVGAVEVSVDNGASWHPATGREAWSYSWTPDRLGAVTLLSRAADDSGNLGAASAGRSVIVTERSCPCTLFGAMVPGDTAINDGAQIEVGVRFRADQNGVITGLRYYKGATWTGTRVGHLWREDGTLLATASFTGESGSGWQQATLSPAVSVTADATYVASYLSSDNSYAADSNFFTTQFDAAPLHAPAAANGVYRYGGGFPTDTSEASNYWADVVFVPAGQPADQAPPTITAVVPPDGSVGADPATKVSAAFDEALNASTVTQDTMQLRDPGGALVPAAVTYAPAAHTASLTPTARLAAATRYTATVTTGVKDVAGNALAALRTWSFTTASAAGPGPGGEPSETPPGTGPLGISPIGLGAGLGTGTAATPVNRRPSPDRVAPRVRVSPRSTRVSRSGTAKLRVACPAGERRCRVTLRLRLAGRRVATRTLSVDGGRARTFALRLSRSARRALARKRFLRVTAVAAARDFAGNRATTRTSIRLRAPVR